MRDKPFAEHTLADWREHAKLSLDSDFIRTNDPPGGIAEFHYFVDHCMHGTGLITHRVLRDDPMESIPLNFILHDFFRVEYAHDHAMQLRNTTCDQWPKTTAVDQGWTFGWFTGDTAVDLAGQFSKWMLANGKRACRRAFGDNGDYPAGPLGENEARWELWWTECVECCNLQLIKWGWSDTVFERDCSLLRRRLKEELRQAKALLPATTPAALRTNPVDVVPTAAEIIATSSLTDPANIAPSAAEITAATAPTHPANAVSPAPPSTDFLPDNSLADDVWLSPSDIRRRCPQLTADMVEGRLRRWRANNSEGWKEVTDRKPREAKYLYRWQSVKTLFEPSGETSGERRAK